MVGIAKEELDSNIAGKFVLVLVFVLAIFLIVLFVFNSSDEITSCNDGTPLGECASSKPYFCLEGNLVENAGMCGCPNNFSMKDEKCISNLQEGARKITLPYVLKGEKGNISFLAYKKVVDYVSDLPTSITYSGEEEVSRGDFVLLKIDDELQRNFLMPLVVAIQNLGYDKENQVRVAISIVQRIPFGDSGVTMEFIGGKNLTYSRYPYEILYDDEGVCGEKVTLLSFLLKELGYGSALIYYSEQNHEALGIKCPEKYSLEGSGYCFIETTGPSIITNNQNSYVGGIKLSNPEIIPIVEGNSLKNLYEYKDAQKFIKLERKVEEKGELNFFDYNSWEKLIEKYGMV